MIFKRRYCRKHGHQLNPDPGDFVLHCTRCQAMVDIYEILRASEHVLEGRHPCVGIPHDRHVEAAASARSAGWTEWQEFTCVHGHAHWRGLVR